MKKAKTIMKYADSDGDKKIDREEFRKVASVFPSLLFPDSHTQFDEPDELDA